MPKGEHFIQNTLRSKLHNTFWSVGPKIFLTIEQNPVWADNNFLFYGVKGYFFRINY